MEQKQNFRRQVAVKLRISDLVTGQYIKEEGLRPNFVILKDNRKVHRVNVIGTVVSIGSETGYNSFYIDDGTGKLSIRSFEQNDLLKKFEVGDIVFIIGKPREYGNEIYVLPEIIRPVGDRRWVEVRLLELKNSVSTAEKDPVAESQVQDEVVEDFVDKDSSALLELIKTMDSGAGANYEDVISKAGMENAEKTLLGLMKNGEVFEVSPGKLKVLE